MEIYRNFDKEGKKEKLSPEIQYIPVDTFNYTPDLGEGKSVLVVIKGNNQRGRSDAFTKNLRERPPGQTYVGRPTRIEPALGKIARFNLSEQTIPSFNELAAPSQLDSLSEPHQITAQYGLIVAVENTKVKVIDPKTDRMQTFDSPWFKSLHTAQLLPDSNGKLDKMLVSSSGIDAAVLVDTSKEKDPDVLTYWSGFNMPDGVTKIGNNRYLSPDGSIEEYDKSGRVTNRLHVSDLPPVGYATADRVLHLNSTQINDGQLYINSFHKGSIATVELAKPDSYNEVAGGYKCSHSLNFEARSKSILSTAEGVWYYNTADGGFGFDFRNLPGKDPQDKDREWLQTSTPIGDNQYAVVDVNRRQLTILDPIARKIRHIPYDSNLAIQMVGPNSLSI